METDTKTLTDSVQSGELSRGAVQRQFGVCAYRRVRAELARRDEARRAGTDERFSAERVAVEESDLHRWCDAFRHGDRWFCVGTNGESWATARTEAGARAELAALGYDLSNPDHSGSGAAVILLADEIACWVVGGLPFGPTAILHEPERLHVTAEDIATVGGIIARQLHAAR